MGEVLKELARQKESLKLEHNLSPDHVHVLVSIPPKYAVAQVIGYLKGKSFIHIARRYFGHKNASDHKFWARDYHVSTIGRDDNTLKNKKKEVRRIDQLTVFDT